MSISMCYSVGQTSLSCTHCGPLHEGSRNNMARYHSSHTISAQHWLWVSCMTSHLRGDCVFISTLSFSCWKNNSSNSHLLIVCIDHLGLSWLDSPPHPTNPPQRPQGDVRLIPASSAAAVAATSWLVGDEVRPPSTMASSDLLSVSSLCCLSLLMVSLSPPSLSPSSSSCGRSTRFPLQRNVEYSQTEPPGLSSLEHLRQNAELAVISVIKKEAFQ